MIYSRYYAFYLGKKRLAVFKYIGYSMKEGLFYFTNFKTKQEITFDQTRLSDNILDGALRPMCIDGGKK
jgi:hypothetical protein